MNFEAEFLNAVMRASKEINNIRSNINRQTNKDYILYINGENAIINFIKHKINPKFIKIWTFYGLNELNYSFFIYDGGLFFLFRI